MTRRPFTAFAVLFLFAGGAFGQTTQPVRGRVGENLSYLKPQSGRILIDCIHQAEQPTQTLGGLRITVFVGPKGSRAYDGDYTVKADAAVTFGITGGSPATVVAPGVVRLAVMRDDQSPQLHLLFPGRTDLPPGLMVIRPGYTEQQAREQVFTTEFIALLRRLNTGVVRAMDWQRINGSAVVKWSDRCTPADLLWGVRGKGGPIEPVIDLCNLLGADLWVNVPHLADDDYVRQLATLIQSRLKPGLRVYVEYSNEVWNTDPGFTQTAWVKQQAAAAGISYRQWYARRVGQIAAIFRPVIPEPGRFVIVLAGQTGDSSVLRDALAFGFKPDALATGGYFGAATTATTPDEVFATFAQNARNVYAGTQIQKFNALADSGPYRKLIYEWTAVVDNAALAQATRDDSRMGGVMLAAGAGIFGNSFEAACNFVPLSDAESKYGATSDPAIWTAKAQALADLSAAHPLPTLIEMKPDPRIAELTAANEALAAQVKVAEAQLAGVTAERDRRSSQVERIKAVANE